MRARYIGDPLDNFAGPDEIDYFGLAFKKGEWTKVPADFPKADKLRGNQTFEVEGGEKTDFEAAEADEKKRLQGILKARGVSYGPNTSVNTLVAKVEATAELPDLNPLDHDGDGKAGGSK